MARVVCLGSPLCGSAAAHGLARPTGARRTLGRSAGLLQQRLSGRGAGRRQVGMVAGQHAARAGRAISRRFEDENDGTVAVAETRLPGLADHVVIPASHSGLLFSAEAARHGGRRSSATVASRQAGVQPVAGDRVKLPASPRIQPEDSMGRGPSIEGRKNATDAKRGKIFTKIIREIGVAARAGGGDPAGNPRLRTAIDKGLSANMSKDVIERAIKKATGELEGVEYEEIRYEGYAPGGVAVIVDCLTDNKVRTVADVRHAFGKFGGNLGTDGSVAFMFRKLGVLRFAAGADEDAITEAAIEAGADDVVVYPDDGAIDVLTAPDAFAGGEGGDGSRGPRRRPSPRSRCAPTTTSPSPARPRSRSSSCCDWLEDLDDVQSVYSNADLGEDAYA